MHLLGQKKYGIWGDFSEKFQVLCKNPDEVTRFDGIWIPVPLGVVIKSGKTKLYAFFVLLATVASTKFRDNVPVLAVLANNSLVCAYVHPDTVIFVGSGSDFPNILIRIRPFTLGMSNKV